MIRETALMAVLTALFLAVGYLVGLYLGDVTSFLTLALILAALANIGSYFFSDRLVLAMTGAKVLKDRSQSPVVYDVVEGLSREAGIPTPKIAVVNTPVPNAFATGRSPKNAVVAVTSGLEQNLTRDEMTGVIGHEISHILDRDILISAMAATIAGAISYLAYMTQWSLYMGQGGGRRDRESGAGSLFLLLGIILVPIAATLIRLAISRSREYLADLNGSKLSGKPVALASALQRIEAIAKRRPIKVNPSTSSLWIISPVSGSSIFELFSTHPATKKRVQRLHEIAGRA